MVTNNSPLVSCIIIFLNAEKFIEEAIASILGQTYDHWELLLVDDGSADNSTNIALRYARQYPEKIRYLHHENHQNRGKNASRNLGVEKARGDYLALLDADDIWLPQKLEEQLAIFDRYPEVGMVYGRTQAWYSWTGNPEDYEKDRFTDLGVQPNTLVFPPTLAILLLEGMTQTPTTCNAILRRQVFERVGLFDENFGDIFEDQIFFAKVELNFPVFVSDECWARYRKHSDSSFIKFKVSAEKNMKIFYSRRLFFLEWVENYLCQQKIDNSSVWNCLHRRRMRLLLKSWLWSLPLFPTFFFWWQNCLDSVMRIGRSKLSNEVRDSLWKLVGRYLYL